MGLMNNESIGLSGIPWPASLRTDYGHGSGHNGACLHATVYGLTCAQYEAMRDRAEDRCELCNVLGTETPRGMLVIDHFEGGGVRFVRGLLCIRCNALMARHDGTAPWGPGTALRRDEARAYHLAAFGQPTAEEFGRADEVIAERCRSVAARFEPREPREPVAGDPEVEAIADHLWASLSEAQISQLALLLLTQLQA